MAGQSRRYPTIKALVLDYVHRHNGVVDYDDLTAEVLEHFPDSAWKKSHWAWYANQIRSGRFKDEFTDEDRENLEPQCADTDPVVKRAGDKILGDARQAIREASGGDPILRFKLNRWVFSRLHLDERKLKQPIKQALWDAGERTCSVCGEPLAALKGLDLHRKDPKLDYSMENCVLLHPKCHRTLA
jgi:hypothetical protein